MPEEKRIELIDNNEMDDIVGYVPSALLRWSLTMVMAVVALLLVGSWFFVYPEMIYGNITIPQASSLNGHKPAIGVAYFPAYNSGMIKTGSCVEVELENYPKEQFGTLSGKVTLIHSKPTSRGLYRVDIVFDNGLLTSRGFRLQSGIELRGHASVVLVERRLFDYIFNKKSSVCANNGG